MNAWAGLPPSEATARTLADRYLGRLPEELRRGLLVGAARDLRTGFERVWLPRVAAAAASAGLRNPMPVAVPAGQTSELRVERSLLTIGLSPEWIDGTRLPATKHREVTNYLAAVQRNAPGSHLVLSTAGLNPGFLEAAPEHARGVGRGLLVRPRDARDAGRLERGVGARRGRGGAAARAGAVIAMSGCAKRNADRELARVLALIEKRIESSRGVEQMEPMAGAAAVHRVREELRALRADLERLEHRRST